MMSSDHPTKELRIATAHLNLAEESFNQAVNCLGNIQGHQTAYEALLVRFSTTLHNLQLQFHELEQRLTSLLPVRTDQQDL
jgi:hypothetical protein